MSKSDKLFSGGIGIRESSKAFLKIGNPIPSFGEISDFWLDVITRALFQKTGVNTWTKVYTDLDVNILNLNNQTSIPANAFLNELNLYSKQICGRKFLSSVDQNGFNNPIEEINRNIVTMVGASGGTITTIGDTATSVGAISTPTVLEIYGKMSNFRNSNNANATTGSSFTNLQFLRGTIPTGQNGFYFFVRLAFPDASYDQVGANTGTRIFVGLTNQSLAQSVQSINPAGSRIGFSRINYNGELTDNNWFITTRDNVTEFRLDTGFPFNVQNVYDFYIFCPKLSNTIYWTIENRTNGTTMDGIVNSNLPLANALMRSGFQLLTRNATQRNILFQKMYVESFY